MCKAPSLTAGAAIHISQLAGGRHESHNCLWRPSALSFKGSYALTSPSDLVPLYLPSSPSDEEHKMAVWSVGLAVRTKTATGIARTIALIVRQTCNICNTVILYILLGLSMPADALLSTPNRVSPST